MTTTTSTSRRSSSSGAIDHRVGSLRIRCSTTTDGDFHLTDVPRGVLDDRRRALVDLPWTMLDQRHGTGVVRVSSPGGGDRSPGDVAITALGDAVLGCWAGDCAPVVLVGAEREFAVVHAGWRGLAVGVLDAAVDAFDEHVVAAVLGPVIGPCCYEFGAADIAAVAAGVHAAPETLAATSSPGRPALDVPGAVRAALAHRRVPVGTVGGCTGCTFPGFSHRARADRSRHVVAAWRPGTPA